MRRVRSTTSRVGHLIGTVLFALPLPLAVAASAGAAVTLTATRTELLYSTESNPDCSKLFALADAALPFWVTRIYATVDNAPPGVGLTFRWSTSKKQKGMLLANQNLGPGAETSAVDGMCADFGNACLLTGKKLKFYNESSILFAAPTCAGLPTDTAKQFHGAVVPIHIKVSAGHRHLGNATVKIGYGRDGSVKLYAWNGDTRGTFPDEILIMKDGLRQKVVGVPLNMVLGATAVPPSVAPGPIENYDFNNGGGAEEVVRSGCPVMTDPSVGACAETDYTTGGRFVPTVAAKFADGSALCDNITVQVLTCSGALRVDVTPKPKLSTYDPANPARSNVEVVVRLKNTSKPAGGLPACGMELRGSNVLSCTEELKVGSVTDSKTTTFDLAHCSKTTAQPCASDADCRPGLDCRTCQAGETCLTQPHCSVHVDRICGNDNDCSNQGTPPPCPNCENDESCVRVLATPPVLFLGPGDTVTLLDQPVVLRNVFPDVARMVDTWTANTTLPMFSAQDTVKYKIRGRP